MENETGAAWGGSEHRITVGCWDSGTTCAYFEECEFASEYGDGWSDSRAAGNLVSEAGEMESSRERLTIVTVLR